MQTKYWAHYDERSGNILGLYNSKVHSVNSIPGPSVVITVGQRNLITQRPSTFLVVNGVLEDKGATVTSGQSDLTELEASVKHEYAEIVGAGIKLDDLYYFADDEASAHITQCLALSAHDQTQFKLKARDKNGIKYVDVNVRQLVKVAKAVNEVRTKAKERLLQENASVRKLVS